jgi:hypothetical protein
MRTFFLAIICATLLVGCVKEGETIEFAGLNITRAKHSYQWERKARSRLPPLRTGPPAIYGYICETRAGGSRRVRHAVSTQRFGDFSSLLRGGYTRECTAVFDKDRWRTIQKGGVPGELCVASFGDKSRIVVLNSGLASASKQRKTSSERSSWKCAAVTLLGPS